jgi:hypothetical protein
VDEAHLEAKLVAGDHRAAELRVVEAHHPDLHRAGVGRRLEQPDAGRLRERLQDQHSRHDRPGREVAGEEVLRPGHVLGGEQTPPRVVLEDAVHEHEGVLGGQLPHQAPDLAGAH